MSNLATIFAAISATASATAAFGALSQVRKAAQGSEANAYLQLMDRYSSAEMRDSIIDLSELWRAAQSHSEAVSDTYVRSLRPTRSRHSRSTIIAAGFRHISSMPPDCSRRG